MVWRNFKLHTDNIFKTSSSQVFHSTVITMNFECKETIIIMITVIIRSLVKIVNTRQRESNLCFWKIVICFFLIIIFFSDYFTQAKDIN